MIYSRDQVPAVYSQSRDFQALLAIVDLIINSIKSDTDNFVSLVNPQRCPAHFLPFLASYVGYEYDYKEKISANRLIIENYPYLRRNRGSEIGLALAVALSVNAVGATEEIEMLSLFHVEYVDEYDKKGKKTGRIRIYVYYPNYLTKIRDLIEVVRPAGVPVEVVPAISIEAAEKIILTDEYRVLRYDYITGKIVNIDNHKVIINDAKEIVDNKKPTEYSISNGYILRKGVETGARINSEMRIIDSNDNYTGYYINNGSIFKEDGENTGYIIIDNDIIGYNIPTGYYLSDSKVYDSNNNDTGYFVNEDKYFEGPNNEITDYHLSNIKIMKKDPTTGESSYTGCYVDVSKSGKILDTYYEIKLEGLSSGCYISVDTGLILDSKDSNGYIEKVLSRNDIVKYGLSTYLVMDEYEYNNHKINEIFYAYITRDSVSNEITNIEKIAPTGWHVDDVTRKFIKDDNTTSSSYYIGKKRFIVDHDPGKQLIATKYFLNKYEDVVDSVGNTYLSKIDRYKISDSNMIGFGEVADDKNMMLTYDSTEILKRYYLYASETVFTADNQYLDVKKQEKEDYND